jgi:hypothetical protein
MMAILSLGNAEFNGRAKKEHSQVWLCHERKIKRGEGTGLWKTLREVTTIGSGRGKGEYKQS